MVGVVVSIGPPLPMDNDFTEYAHFQNDDRVEMMMVIHRKPLFQQETRGTEWT
jgi:hypothetical protein